MAEEGFDGALRRSGALESQRELDQVLVAGCKGGIELNGTPEREECFLVKHTAISANVVACLSEPGPQSPTDNGGRLVPPL